MEVIGKIIEIMKEYPLKLKYSKFVFGAHYKAFVNDKGKLVLCSCEKQSILNRIKIYNTYKKEFSNENLYYKDYVYDKEYSPLTIEQFLGLPKELEIDYKKDIITQIVFEDNICHRCCGVDYEWIIPEKNPFHYKSLAKKTRNARRDLEKENYFISKGILYIPVVKVSYVLVDVLEEKAKEILKPTIDDFPIREQVCVGYMKFEPNKDKDKEVAEINQFLSLPLDLQLKVLYRNYDNKSVEKIPDTYDKSLLNLTNEFSSRTGRAVNIYEMKSIEKKVRDLQTYYLKDFPLSTSPLSLIKELYNEALNYDEMYYGYEDISIEDSFYRAYTNFCNEIIPFLNKYLDLDGDVHISFINQDNELVEPIKYLIILSRDKNLMIRAGIPLGSPYDII